MDVRSLGYRTDLALLARGGSEIEERGDHLVVRTPANPDYWWGNCILLEQDPPVEQAERWVQAFREALPAARHVAIGVDAPDGGASDTFTAVGLTRHSDSVMRATAVHEPPRPARHATYRPLVSDADWAQHVELRLACHDAPEGDSPEVYHAFVETVAGVARTLVEDGHGIWMGAFVDGRLDCQMGLVDAGEGLARFQSVETRPSARGRGLAGTLTHVTSRHGLDRLGARTLVMVADPDYVAIRVYESVGFERAEVQVAWERAPGAAV